LESNQFIYLYIMQDSQVDKPLATGILYP